MKKDRVTIPTDSTLVEETKEISKLWGGDAIRDCDGVELPKNPKEIADLVYKAYFVVRGDNRWAEKHPEEAHRIFLESKRVTSTGESLTIDVTLGYLGDQIEPDVENVSYWQVFDRTTNEEVKDFTLEGTKVTFETTPYHQYSVDFMAKVLWHPTQIYNYLTNNWTCEKEKVYDPSYPNTREYIKQYLINWCENNPDINVVRFTTFLYQFTLVFNEHGKEKNVDWFGYALTASPRLIEAFEQESGIHLTAEDFVDNGRYNTPFKNPTEKFAKYIDFIQRFVVKVMRELVDICHKYNKQAMMFLGDDWIGSEPYGKYFKDMNLDSVVGSVGGGVTVRMLAEIPHVKVHEGRFLPYFFPDTFFEGNEENAIKELNKNWMSSRRALLRSPLQRMGFGGYLSLVYPFKNFVNRVAEICDEFRKICPVGDYTKPYSVAKVAIVNAWGKLRSWQSHMVAHELWYQQIYSYQGVLESISGLPVDVEFISFDDILANGIPEDIDVIINVGSEFTAYSGDTYWSNPKLIAKIRKWVAEGHGFIGVGEPTSLFNNGRAFALSDVLGVEQEKGQTLSEDKYNIHKVSHFITEGVRKDIDYGESTKNIYALEGTQVLDIKFSDRFIRYVNVGEVLLASNEYFQGRGVYFAGLPFSLDNSRLLLKAICYAAHKEDELLKAYSTHIDTEVAYFPETKTYIVINNTFDEVTTDFYDIEGNKTTITLKPNETRWIAAK